MTAPRDPPFTPSLCGNAHEGAACEWHNSFVVQYRVHCFKIIPRAQDDLSPI
jgi:hypothetical protein